VISASTLLLTNELEPIQCKNTYTFQSNRKGLICTYLWIQSLYFHINILSAHFDTKSSMAQLKTNFILLPICICSCYIHQISGKISSTQIKIQVGIVNILVGGVKRRSSPELMRTRCFSCAASIKHSSILCKETPYSSFKPKTLLQSLLPENFPQRQLIYRR
jgi:hypothetical protein